MQQSTSSNLAIVLVLLAWPLAYYGFMSQLGDYSPSTPRDVMDADRRQSVLALFAGLLFLSGSLCLAGYGFTGARLRSLAAIVLCIAPLAVATLSLWP